MQSEHSLAFDILTLFPEMFVSPLAFSITKRAQDRNLVSINLHNLRDFANDKRKSVDDRPYGGGPGMVIRVDIVDQALKMIKGEGPEARKVKTILLDPSGPRLNQDKVQALLALDQIILICGRYEGVDERIKEHLVDEVISIGDYILSGGELAAMVVIDSIIRLIPGALGDEQSAILESFSETEVGGKRVRLLDWPQYTHPEEYQGWGIPEILKSGDHKKIQQWRINQAIQKTKRMRPDLLEESIT